MNLYTDILKSFFDRMISGMALLVFLPLLCLLSLLLFFANKGTPFFVQPRPGKGGKVFKLVKFKTMNDKRDAQGVLLPDGMRLTPVGKFIRKISLDELPQLWNVVCGHMSLVGPRPLLVSYLPLYTPFQMRRHEVKPGITGWAQVNGRNAISWEEKFNLDVWYVDHRSLLVDCKILWLTVKKVFKTEGISQQGHATMPFFTGAPSMQEGVGKM